MILDKGEILHIVFRRLFEGDLRRHFVGKVKAVEGVLARLKGYAFVYDEATNQFAKRPEARQRIVGLADPGLIINVLPEELDIEKLRYEVSGEGIRVLTDGQQYQLDVSEFGSRL